MHWDLPKPGNSQIIPNGDEGTLDAIRQSHKANQQVVHVASVLWQEYEWYIRLTGLLEYLNLLTVDGSALNGVR